MLFVQNLVIMNAGSRTAGAAQSLERAVYLGTATLFECGAEETRMRDRTQRRRMARCS